MLKFVLQSFGAIINGEALKMLQEKSSQFLMDWRKKG